jgi:hypothetical protein
VAFTLWALGSSTIDPGAAWVRLMSWITATQTRAAPGAGLEPAAVREQGAVAGLGLVTLGFLYGVFHAAGPGHGKVVIATFLATQRETLGRGRLARGHGLAAPGPRRHLACSSPSRSWSRPPGRASSSPGESKPWASLSWPCSALFSSGATAGGCSGRKPKPPATLADTTTPAADQGLRRRHPLDRPSPLLGAILVLVLAVALDLRLAGIAAVIAMSIGTGLTVSGFAALTVLAAIRPAGWPSASTTVGARLARLADMAALAGGLLLLAMGLALLDASLSTPAHPLLGRSPLHVASVPIAVGSMYSTRFSLSIHAKEILLNSKNYNLGIRYDQVQFCASIEPLFLPD